MKKEARVEIDEIDVRFFFLHVIIIYVICLCVSIDWLGMYKLKKSSAKISETLMLRAKHVTIHSNLFTHYKFRLILKKLHGGTQSVVYTTQNFDNWYNRTYMWSFLVIVGVLTLLAIKKVFSTYHKIIFTNKQKICKPNINALVEKNGFL